MITSYKRFIVGMRRFLRGRFNLREDGAVQQEVHDRIESGVVIRGTNLWVLIFATFIASIGLNVNSTAVIIGAMLISPLMGPIMGMGLALGVNDFELLKRSAKNFGFMTVIAIMTSTLYFMISPWTVVQSELLARTQPTTWDVLIAFFGGLAGMVAQTRKDKSLTVLPGVAIATALMPPLCTAGFGLATLQFNYFFGAFYLFIINTVFIAIASFVITNSLKYKKKLFVDPKKGRRVKHIMAIIILATIVPSVFIGYNLIRKSIFEQNVNNFIAKSFVFSETKVVDYKVKYNSHKNIPSNIDIILYGKPLSKDVIEILKSQLSNFDITNTSLTIQQAEDNSNLASTFIQSNFEELIREKNEKIKTLNAEVEQSKEYLLPTSDLSREMSALFNMPINLALSHSVMYNSAGEPTDTMVLCYIKYSEVKLSQENKTRITDWLKIRTNISTIKIIDELEDVSLTKTN